jgi:Type II secretion system (T2SS), protein M subtype b
MMAYRRRRQQYLLASLLAVLGVINLLFFFILYRPVRSEYFTLQDSIQKARTDIRTRQYNIERLEKLNVQLETSSQDKFRLYTMHFIPKEMGWSRIVPELDTMIQKAGVKNTRKDYSLDDKPEYGLYSVKIKLPVTGSYTNVVNLIKDIESDDTFFIIDSVEVRPNAAGSADVTMTLNLETFFYQ